MSHVLRILAAFALVFGIAGGALAMGSGTSSDSTTTTTTTTTTDDGKGEKKSEYKRAVDEINRGDYERAIPILEGIVG